jgi:carbonic anhydrase
MTLFLRWRALGVASMAALSLLATACSSTDDTATPTAEGTDEEAAPAATEEAAEASEADEHPAWGYTAEDGPDRWGEDYPTCGTGIEQSPIDLTGATEEDIADIAFAYGQTPLEIFNNGHTIEVEPAEAMSIELNGTTYDVAQFHFHAGSEHQVDGQQFPMEMHIVHTAGNALAVVGVMIQEGAENAALAPVFDNIPTAVSEEAQEVEGQVVDLDAILPSTRTYYQYSGSLTTPPCSEDVAWQVLDTPIEVSAEQLAAFTAVVNGNFRPVQPLGERILIDDAA